MYIYHIKSREGKINGFLFYLNSRFSLREIKVHEETFEGKVSNLIMSIASDKLVKVPLLCFASQQGGGFSDHAEIIRKYSIGKYEVTMMKIKEEDLFENGDIILADGHHRYKALLRNNLRALAIPIFLTDAENLKLEPSVHCIPHNTILFDEIMKMSFVPQSDRQREIYYSISFKQIKLGLMIEDYLTIFKSHACELESQPSLRLAEISQNLGTDNNTMYVYVENISYQKIERVIANRLIFVPRTTYFYPKPEHELTLLLENRLCSEVG